MMTTVKRPITVKTPIRADEVLQGARHVLFVEGSDPNSVDPKILRTLLRNEIRIEPLGPSFSVQSVAEALHKYHPTYYFLIDRDHHKDDFVDRCWNDFPNPDTHNLLIWRRREIENYFLDPEYLSCSQYHRTSKDDLSNQILRFARQRVYLDVTNQVIISVREELKSNWITTFTDLSKFSTRDCALANLRKASEFDQYCDKVSRCLSFEQIEKRFNDSLKIMTGGEKKIVFSRGKWLSWISGKEVLNQVVNSRHFRVQGSTGIVLQGLEKLDAIITQLLQKELDNMPADFIALREIIMSRVDESR